MVIGSCFVTKVKKILVDKYIVVLLTNRFVLMFKNRNVKFKSTHFGHPGLVGR